MKSAATYHLAQKAFHKHKAVHGSFDHYAGIVSLHGYARLASECEEPDLLEEIRSELMPYVRGERENSGNFPNYSCGGNATAWLLYQGHLPEAAETVRHYADEIMHDAPRDRNGILCRPRQVSEEVIWIDVAFAVTPFLLFAGLALGKDAYIEEAFQQTAKMVRGFHVEETGLLFQSINMRGPGHRSEDHWSRGNGWGALALAELAVYLPKDHPRKAEAVEIFVAHVNACAKFQNANGLWHQEMTEPDFSYVETSGSALMLYALGLGIAGGLIEDSERGRFEKGLKGLLAYISDDIDIFHTCRGCLCPGQGTKLEYMARPPVLNDIHAFGPVVLAMGQAHQLGLKSI
jgi:unsaturated rhamnogalacturonyl hydrolase